MQPRILLVQTYYSEFLAGLYADDPALGDLDFESQRRAVHATAFGVGGAYSHGLRALGCEAHEVIVNADILQARWATERDLCLIGNVHDQRRQILASQIEHYRPDVLYIFEWCPLGDAFLAEIKSRVRLLVGQISSPLRPDRSYAAYDLMISSWPPIVDHFRHNGTDAVPLKLAFDHRVWDRLSSSRCDRPESQSRSYDVTFVGGFGSSHVDRIVWLERLLEDVDIDIFGYGADQIPEGSPIHRHHHGPIWGMQMYDVLHTSRITLHQQATIDVSGDVSRNFAAAMRLYEATGVGTCLVTEQKANLHEMFAPNVEVVTYRDEADCVERIGYYLAKDEQRSAIARAGRQRTHREHTYDIRMAELLQVLQRRL